MPFAEDEHPVGDLGPGGEHEPFRISVRACGDRIYGQFSLGRPQAVQRVLAKLT